MSGWNDPGADPADEWDRADAVLAAVSDVDRMLPRGFARRTLAALREAGYAVVAMPAPLPDDPSDLLLALWDLPARSVIRDSVGIVWRKVGVGMYGWEGTGLAAPRQPDTLLHRAPLTLLLAGSNEAQEAS